MGSFEGHILPGTFFILFGIWWTTQIAKIRANREDHLSSRSSRRRKSSTSVYSTTFQCGFRKSLPMESIIKVVFTFIGICIETNDGVRKPFFEMSNIQHIIMYSTFLLNGISEIIVHFTSIIPKGSVYFTAALSFLVESLLFWYHIEHQTKFEQSVHILLIFAISLCTLASVVESWMPANIDFKYVRAFFVILQGTWFWQIAFLLYNPLPGYPRLWHTALEHTGNMWLSVFFALHCMSVLILQFGITCLAYLFRNRLRRQHNHDLEYSQLPLTEEIKMENRTTCHEDESYS